MDALPNVHESLIPGLPDQLVLLEILSRFPRYTQLSLRTVSKAWRRALRQPPPVLNSRTCKVQSASSGLLIFHEDSQLPNNLHPKQFSISLVDQDGQTWRKLPIIPGLKFGVFEWCGLVCLGGMVFVLGGRNPETNEKSADVYMLDLSAKSWHWQRCSSMRTARLFREQASGCVAILGRIYVIDGCLGSLEVYDINTDQWHNLPPATTKPKDGWLRMDGTLNFLDQLFVYGWEVLYSRPIFASPYIDYTAHIYCPETGSWRRVGFPPSVLGPLAVLHDQVYRLGEDIPRRFDASTLTWVNVQGELPAYEGHKLMKVVVSRDCRSRDGNGECSIIYALDYCGRLWRCKMDGDGEDRLVKRKKGCSTRFRSMWELVQAPILLHSQSTNICITA